MPATPDLKRIGRYDIERVLGEGAMGVVYEGNDPRLHRKVAIKTILKSALDSDSAAEYSARFAREAQAVARLNHPNIVQVFDFAEEGELAYIVMELVRGKELKQFFEARERFELKEIAHIMGELCDALHFAHQTGIIHRDIKPANVMIDSAGRVKLTDFGVARVSDPNRTVAEQTQAGTVVGTPAYMSPEQIQSEKLDRRTDIFSAGIILYEFLAGEKPFTGSGAWTIAKKILQETPAAPSTINKTLSPLFDHVVAKALAKDVNARYQTARDLGMALKRALEGLPEIDEAEKTVILAPGAAAQQLPTKEADATVAMTATAMPRNQAVELEFWRSIKDGSDPADFELYVQQFPSGIYAALAKRKIAKLKGTATEEPGARTVEQEKREAEEAARREAEAKAKLAAEKAELEARLARREAEMAKREAELKKLAEEAPRRPPLVPVLVTLAVAAAIGGAWYALRPDPAAERVAELTRLLEQSRQREAELTQSREREGELRKELELARQREAEALKAGDLKRQQELAEQIRQREAEAAKQAELTRQRAEALRKQAEAAERARLQVEAARKTSPIAKATEPARAPEPARAEAPRAPEARAPEPVKLAGVTAPSPAPEPAAMTVEAMLQQAIALEGEGKYREARRILVRITQQSTGQAAGQAAKRLGDMLARGVPGVQRDYGEALRYYETARLNGVEVQTTRGR